MSRGETIESEHRIDAVVVGGDDPVIVWGDGDRPVIARSALKFVQAVPLLRTGAADRFDISPEELVLACSSHSGEPAHVEAIRRWLGRIGLGPSSLECGPDLPLGADASALHIGGGGRPEAILNCCSGKHTGFLTVARHLDLDPVGYIEPDHPVQRLVTAAVEEFTGHGLQDQVPGRDGCGIPTFGIPLSGLATAMSRLVDVDRLDERTAAASTRLIEAVIGREFWISGTGRHEVTLGGLAGEPLLVKAGAEGVYMAALPDRSVGIAVKAADGAARAAEVAISAVLAHLGVIPGDRVERDVTNKAGAVVGRLTVEHSEPMSREG